MNPNFIEMAVRERHEDFMREVREAGGFEPVESKNAQRGNRILFHLGELFITMGSRLKDRYAPCCGPLCDGTPQKA